MLDWQKNFKQGKELILATSHKDKPNANIAISLGFHDSKLLIADCQMRTTNKNLKENPNICIIAGYLRLKGTAEIQPEGKYFDMAKEKTKEYIVKNAIIVTPKEVYDLDKGKILFS